MSDPSFFLGSSYLDKLVVASLVDELTCGGGVFGVFGVFVVGGNFVSMRSRGSFIVYYF